jgi:hypothetical protein
MPPKTSIDSTPPAVPETISVPEDFGFELPEGVDQFELTQIPGPGGRWYHKESDSTILCPTGWRPNAPIPDSLQYRKTVVSI